jgi:hypothetical protein
MLLCRLWHWNPSFGYGGIAPRHHRSPTSANKPAGQDSWAFMTPGLDDSTAPIADECQSFLDNLVAQFGPRRAWNDRPGSEFDIRL